VSKIYHAKFLCIFAGNELQVLAPVTENSTISILSDYFIR